MTRNRNLRAVWLIPLTGFLVLAALPAVAHAVTVSDQGGNLSFTTLGTGGDMTLRVSGRDFVSTQNFRSGETAWFAPVDREGYQLPDGAYNWEISVAPARGAARQPISQTLARGKTPADGRSVNATPAPGGQRHSGNFTISNGVMVDSGLVEVAAPRATVSAPAESAAARAAERSAERSGRADDGIAPQRRVARDSSASSAAVPTAAERAAEHNDRDGN